MLDLDTHITPKAEEIGLAFKIEETALAQALSASEARSLLNELVGVHGVGICADIAEDVRQEFTE